MTYSLIFWQVFTCFLFEVISYQGTRIRNIFCSILKAIILFWNSFLFELLLFLTWLLCIVFPSRLCTKNIVLSAIGKIPKTTDGTVEEMIAQVVGYVRVSSREQANNSHALDQQTARVRSAGAQYIFEDVQKGRGKKRLAYDEMIRLVKCGKIQKIIITRIDRASRSIRQLQELIEILNEYGVILIVLDQNLDLSTAQGKMWLNMLGVLAEWEVDLLSERVRYGKEHQRDQQWANSSCPWGYEVVNHQYVLDQTPFLCLLGDRPKNYQDFSQVDDWTLLPHRTIAELARDCIDIFWEKKAARRALKAIFDKYGIVKTHAKGTGVDKIFHWTVPGFLNWLRNPVLDGHTTYLHYRKTQGKRALLPQEQWQMVRDTHPNQRMFREGEAEAVKLIIQSNASNAGGFQIQLVDQSNYRPFAYQTGLIYCGKCGSRCTSKGCSTSIKYLYYACRHAGVGCHNCKSIKRSKIEESLIEALVEKSQYLNQEESAISKTLPTYSERLARLEAKLAWLEQSPGFDPEIEDLKRKTQQEIEEQKNPFLSKKQVLDSSVEDLIRAGNNLAIWHLLNNDEKVEIYRKLVKKIYIGDGKVISIIFHQ